MDASPPCPSFNAYASTADTADKVAREEKDDYGFLEPSMAGLQLRNHADEDFEFVTYHESGYELCLDNCVGPVYPIFNRDVFKVDDNCEKSQKNEYATVPGNHEADGGFVGTSLRSLFVDEEDRRRGIIDPPSSSSSEADDLDSISPGSYCIWTPDSGKASPNRCKKSKSTGSSSSKRWKLLEFLCRSNSDGKDKFVFLTPPLTMKRKGDKSEISKEEWSSSPGSGIIPHVNKVTDTKARTTSSATGRSKSKVSPHEVFYVRYRALKEVDKKRSYLPYRQDLVGFRANLGAFGTKRLPMDPF